MIVAEQRIEAIRYDLWRPDPRVEGWVQSGLDKYGEEFLIAELAKREMRQKYARLAKPMSYERARAESTEFWSAYEEINRKRIPEDPVYTKVAEGVTLNVTNDVWELGASATGQLRILESFIGGEAVASAVNRVRLVRVSTQGTGTSPTAYTPEKFSTRSPAAAGTYYGAIGALVTWGTAQATLAANSLVLHSFNAFGGADRWVAQPGEEIYSVNAEFISMRSQSGTSIVSAYVVVEEL